MQVRRQRSQRGDGGLGAALFDARDLIDGHVSPAGQVGDAETWGAALIVYGLARRVAMPATFRCASGDGAAIHGSAPKAGQNA
jgi:hypothetical protein